jgi:hypothetical protein
MTKEFNVPIILLVLEVSGKVVKERCMDMKASKHVLIKKLLWKNHNRDVLILKIDTYLKG